jgi:tetratricopeptide (TPR) repeat protein
VKGRELPQVLMNWADLMAKLDKPDSAEIFYKRALNRSVYKAQPANALANFYVKRGEVDSAKAYFATAYESDSSYVIARVNLANLKLDSGDTATAVDDYLAVLAVDPDLIQVNLNLAVVYFRQQKYEQALQYARRAVEIDSTYEPALRLVRMLQD